MATLSFSLTPHFARMVITQVMSVLGRDVSLADSKGALLASYDPSLVGTEVAGVKRLLGAKEPVSIDQNQAVGFAIIHEGETLGALIIHADPESVKEFVPITRSLIELMITQEAENTLAGNADQLLWQLFHSVTDAEREKLIAEAKLLGIDLTKPRFAVLIEVPGFSEGLSRTSQKAAAIHRFKEKLAREVGAIFPTSNDNTITYFGQDRFLLLKDAGKGEETLQMFRTKGPSMLKNLGRDLTAGVGGLYLGVAGLLKSWREADTALRLGLKLRKPGQLYFVDDLGLYVVFGNVGSDKQVDVAKRLLGPLLKDPDLLKTVRGYFQANLNLTKAAGNLHIHRNTLIYRLEKIKDLIGLDPEQFEDAVQIKLALTLLDLE